MSAILLRLAVDGSAIANAIWADLNGVKISPKAASSPSPWQALASPWVLGKKCSCPVWAASQSSVIYSGRPQRIARITVPR